MDKKTLLLNRLKEVMIIHDITGSKLSITSTVSESDISDIINGIKQPTLTTMLKICKGIYVCSGIKMKTGEVFEDDFENVKIV